MSLSSYLIESAREAELQSGIDLDLVKEACYRILEACESGELGDIKTELPDSEGFDNATGDVGEFVDSPDVADKFNNADVNLNELIDDEDLEEAFNVALEQEDMEDQSALTEVPHNAEKDQYENSDGSSVFTSEDDRIDSKKDENGSFGSLDGNECCKESFDLGDWDDLF